MAQQQMAPKKLPDHPQANSTPQSPSDPFEKLRALALTTLDLPSTLASMAQKFSAHLDSKLELEVRNLGNDDFDKRTESEAMVRALGRISPESLEKLKAKEWVKADLHVERVVAGILQDLKSPAIVPWIKLQEDLVGQIANSEQTRIMTETVRDVVASLGKEGLAEMKALDKKRTEVFQKLNPLFDERQALGQKLAEAPKEQKDALEKQLEKLEEVIKDLHQANSECTGRAQQLVKDGLLKSGYESVDSGELTLVAKKTKDSPPVEIFVVPEEIWVNLQSRFRQKAPHRLTGSLEVFPGKSLPRIAENPGGIWKQTEFLDGVPISQIDKRKLLVDLKCKHKFGEERAEIENTKMEAYDPAKDWRKGFSGSAIKGLIDWAFIDEEFLSAPKAPKAESDKVSAAGLGPENFPKKLYDQIYFPVETKK